MAPTRPTSPSTNYAASTGADLIVEVTDSDGEVCYVAAEASYTVNGRDTERAIRNAGLLTKLTRAPQPRGRSGLPTGRPDPRPCRVGRGVLVSTNLGSHAGRVSAVRHHQPSATSNAVTLRVWRLNSTPIR